MPPLIISDIWKDNPLLETKRFNASKVSKKNNPKFLTVPQMTGLLNAADPSLVPYLSICAFAGLRGAEAKRLSWQQVDLKRNLITVPEQISKTGEERKIPIQPNLAVWLAPQARETGYILPANTPSAIPLACFMVRLLSRIVPPPHHKVVSKGRRDRESSRGGLQWGERR